MGMSIDDCIRYIKDLRNAGGCGYQQANIAIDTMQKYQQIEQIINNAEDSDGAIKYNWLYEHIKEVLEDGNDD